MLHVLGSVLLVRLATASVAAPVEAPQANCTALSAAFGPACDCANVLQARWYNAAEGGYDTTDLWRGGEALQATLDFARYSGNTDLLPIVKHILSIKTPTVVQTMGSTSYDDQGWWVLNYLSAFETFKEATYLAGAKQIFDGVLKQAWSDDCGGGLWWSSRRSYKNAITNQLALQGAIRLYANGAGDEYLATAQRIWAWLEGSGMMNGDNLFNDGLDIDAQTKACTNNGQVTWTYNQGVVLGGLAWLAESTGNGSLVQTASAVADAAIIHLVTSDGILQEPCGDDCNNDQKQFKGIFARNLRQLMTSASLSSDQQQRYEAFLEHNSAVALSQNRLPDGRFGGKWQGPVDPTQPTADQLSDGLKQELIGATNATGATPQTSVLDLLVAAGRMD